MLLKLIKANLTLSLPILFTRLVGMGSNLIAMIFLAKLGTNALSASAIIMGIFAVCILLLMSFNFSVCALIAEANANQHFLQIGNILQSAFFLNFLLAIPFIILFYNVTPILIKLHQPIAVAELTGQYFKGLIIGYIPMLWGNIVEQFLIGINKPKFIVYLSIYSFVIMPLISYIFIFGKFGISGMGVLGAGYAISLTSIINLLILFALIMVKRWQRLYALFNLRFDRKNIGKLFKLGWPIALQYTGEFTAYILITLMMGWVGVLALAAQQIILQCTAVVTIIPVSIAQATTVLVANARAQSNNHLINSQVDAALIIVCFIMIIVSLIYYFFPDQLVQIYLDSHNIQNKTILSLTETLLMIVAFSQFFDAIKNVLSGAYRGLQMNKIPMLISTIGLWLLSIPFAYIFGFFLHFEAIGIRLGFALGIVITCAFLSQNWYGIKKSNRTDLTFKINSQGVT